MTGRQTEIGNSQRANTTTGEAFLARTAEAAGLCLLLLYYSFLAGEWYSGGWKARSSPAPSQRKARAKLSVLVTCTSTSPVLHGGKGARPVDRCTCDFPASGSTAASTITCAPPPPIQIIRIRKEVKGKKNWGATRGERQTNFFLTAPRSSLPLHKSHKQLIATKTPPSNQKKPKKSRTRSEVRSLRAFPSSRPTFQPIKKKKKFEKPPRKTPSKIQLLHRHSTNPDSSDPVFSQPTADQPSSLSHSRYNRVRLSD